MSQNIIKQFTDPELAIVSKIKEIQLVLEQLKAQQPPSIKLTPTSTVSFSMLGFNKATASGLIGVHNILATLTPPEAQVLFAIPEVDFFFDYAPAIPTLSTNNLFPISTGVNSEFADFSTYYDYFNSTGQNIVAKINTRNRADATSGTSTQNAIVVVRWRYMTPGAST